MSFALRAGYRVFLYERYIDLRWGFERLALCVRENQKRDLLEGDLFVFLGNNRRRCKALCFDGSGLVLVTKRLEHGQFLRLAQLELGNGELTYEEFAVLFSGGVVLRPKFGSCALTRAHGGGDART